MTEHTKLPLPPEDGDEPTGESSIQRAASSFDWRRLMPPPIPEVASQPAPRHVQKARKPRLDATPDVFDAPAVTPDSAPAMAEPAVAAPPQVPAARFNGPHHPVDRQLLREQGMIVPEGSVTGLLEEFRIIKRQILTHVAELRAQDAVSGKAQRVLICSPLPGEGKTYCAVNLALSIAAEKESEVLLVDADFAKPSVLSTLGLPGGPGLMDALTDPSLDVADLVLGTDIPGLWVLPAGNATNSDSEYLNSSRTAGVLARLTDGAPHRIVIFDSPPALAASPAAELAKYVGQAIVVARADRTGQGALEDAISLLSACPDIQLLLNAANFSPSGRRFGSYYGYKG
jgi:Mrp family chromosome partitioning ATPase